MSAADSIWVYLHNHSYFCERHMCNVKSAYGRSRSIQGHPRSLTLVPIESAYAISYYCSIVNLVLSCTVSEIRRLIGRKIAKIASSNPPQSHKSPSLGATPCDFLTSHTLPESEIIGLSEGEEIMTLAYIALSVWYNTRCDRRMDGHVAVTNTRSTHSVARVTFQLLRYRTLPSRVKRVSVSYRRSVFKLTRL